MVRAAGRGRHFKPAGDGDGPVDGHREHEPGVAGLEGHGPASHAHGVTVHEVPVLVELRRAQDHRIPVAGPAHAHDRVPGAPRVRDDYRLHLAGPGKPVGKRRLRRIGDQTRIEPGEPRPGPVELPIADGNLEDGDAERDHRGDGGDIGKNPLRHRQYDVRTSLLLAVSPFRRPADDIKPLLVGQGIRLGLLRGTQNPLPVFFAHVARIS